MTDKELREKVAEKLYGHSGLDAKWPYMEEFYLEVAEDIIPLIQRETRREIAEKLSGWCPHNDGRFKRECLPCWEAVIGHELAQQTYGSEALQSEEKSG